jgi:hypothetical protein
MPNVVTIGKRLIPLDQIAFVEPFDPTRNPNFKPSKEFKTRLVLLNREIVLAEEKPRAFADSHGMRFLEEDQVGINPTIGFRIETFEATEDFKPEKPFQSRLKWRDSAGMEQSKLLLAKPESLVEIVGVKTTLPPGDRLVGVAFHAATARRRQPIHKDVQRVAPHGAKSRRRMRTQRILRRVMSPLRRSSELSGHDAISPSILRANSQSSRLAMYSSPQT